MGTQTGTGTDHELIVFDPDGTLNPLTIEFPDSTTLSQGHTFSIFNQNRTSTTTIALSSNSSSSSDEIVDPTDRSAAPASSHASLTLTRAYVQWVLILDNHVNPTWYVLVYEEK